MEITLGKRIKSLRKALRISQGELAQNLEMDRASLSLVENDKRKLKTSELVLLAKSLNISVDELLDLKIRKEIVFEETKKNLKVRSSKKNLKKFKEVLIYILNVAGAKPNFEETVLYKLLYFIDFDYYEKYENHIMGATYIKDVHGPTPLEFQSTINEMIESKEIQAVKSKYFLYPQKKYLPLRVADLSIFNGNEITLIDNVLHKLSGMYPHTINQYTHQDIPCSVTPIRKKIKYESVFGRTVAYSVRPYEKRKA